MGTVSFQDFYGQHVQAHNETGDGNIRLEVRTTSSLNDLILTKKEDCNIVTNLSLDEDKATMLYLALKTLIEQER